MDFKGFFSKIMLFIAVQFSELPSTDIIHDDDATGATPCISHYYQLQRPRKPMIVNKHFLQSSPSSPQLASTCNSRNKKHLCREGRLELVNEKTGQGDSSGTNAVGSGMSGAITPANRVVTGDNNRKSAPAHHSGMNTAIYNSATTPTTVTSAVTSVRPATVARTTASTENKSSLARTCVNIQARTTAATTNTVNIATSAASIIASDNLAFATDSWTVPADTAVAACNNTSDGNLVPNQFGRTKLDSVLFLSDYYKNGIPPTQQPPNHDPFQSPYCERMFYTNMVVSDVQPHPKPQPQLVAVSSSIHAAQQRQQEQEQQQRDCVIRLEIDRLFDC